MHSRIVWLTLSGVIAALLLAALGICVGSTGF
ncbi:MAG: hypothetical protein RLY95_774, partial [Pseudomonadota bacterium]